MENIVSTLGMQDGLHYHRLIIEAIRARDTQAAESIMQEHVDRTIVRLKAAAGLPTPGATRTGDRPALFPRRQEALGPLSPQRTKR
jgi:hypothetical protein